MYALHFLSSCFEFERKEGGCLPPPPPPLRPSPIQHFTLYSFNLKSEGTHNQRQYNEWYLYKMVTKDLLRQNEDKL